MKLSFRLNVSALGTAWSCARKFRILTIIEAASRECLALIVARQLKHEGVLASLAGLFIA